MDNAKLRKTIGARAKSRRKELKLSMQYVAEQLDVNKTTIQRYENGSIDNSKKLVVEGLAGALHVSAAWLRGETDDMQAEMSDKKEILIRTAMQKIMESFPLDMRDTESEFSKSILLLLLNEYQDFNRSLSAASEKYTDSGANAKMAEAIGFESGSEYNEVMFLREITHSINAFNEISDIMKMYSRNPETALTRLDSLLGDYPS